jgi:GDSL-like Lipase/Acylhydrolase family
MRPLRVLVATTIVVATATAAAPVGASPAALPDTDYAALGDSAAAGPLVLPMDLDQPGCHRSEVNYPSLAAMSLGVRSLHDVTCDGADFDDVHRPKSTDFGDMPPQIEAITADTDLVTLHFGANDIGLVGAAMDCINLLPQPFGDSCKAEQTAGGVDRLKAKIDATAPELVATLDAIRSRAPQARIFVVGYATYLPSNGCYPLVPVWKVDANYIRSTLDSLNAMLRTTAVANDAGYIDLATPSVGHDMCKAPGVRWVEPLIPGSIAAPLHPNNIGMVGFAQAVVATVQ